MTTTVCSAVQCTGLATATLSADTVGNDLLGGAGWLSTAATEAMEPTLGALPAPQ